MPRPKKNQVEEKKEQVVREKNQEMEQVEEKKEISASYKDYDVFNEEVYQAVKEGRVVKVGSRWRVYPKKDRE